MAHNSDDVLSQAIGWMRRRGWNRKIAKSATGQSLLDHTLIELDVFLSLAPIFADPNAFGLNETEESIVLASLLCHDVGKETEEWQQYVHGTTEHYVPHVDPVLLTEVVPEICGLWGLERVEPAVRRTVELCARYHHSRPGRDDATILEAMLDAKPSFLPLARIVMDIDRLCSADTAQSAVAYVSKSDLGNHVATDWHQVSIRGVSTAFLHKAAESAFEARGWRPLIYFADASVYFAKRSEHCNAPQVDEVRRRLREALAATVEKEMPPLMVGDPTANILPKPDLVSWHETRRYFQLAGKKVSPLSFGKKAKELRLRVVQKYVGSTTIGDDVLELHSGRISHAQPEMVVFKLFKALLDRNKVPEISPCAVSLAESLYDEVFGAGGWRELQSTSTLMPAKDMAATVDRYWNLDASAIGGRQGIKVEALPDNERLRGLVELLNQLIAKVVASENLKSPRDELTASLADAFLVDLIRPSDSNHDVRSVAGLQAMHYMESKPMAGKQAKESAYTCPICNAAFQSGRKASADFVDKPQSHTNRGVSHGSFGYIMICNGCYYERLLRQVLMGWKPAQVILMAPPWNVGPRNGQRIVSTVREVIDRAAREMRGEAGHLGTRFSFGMTQQVAEKLDRLKREDLDPSELLALFRYRAENADRRRRSEVEKRLKEDYAEDLNALNAICGTTYQSWETVVDALTAPGPLADELDEVRRTVFQLYPTMAFVCETPNLVFIPLMHAIGSADESDTNTALRTVFAALLLHHVFHTTIAIHAEPDEIDIANSSGAAWIPRVPAIRSLITAEWVPNDEADLWLTRIAAAARLARLTEYPERSALYQTITADPAERIIRRIESQGGVVSITDVALIQKLPFFRTVALYKEAKC